MRKNLHLLLSAFILFAACSKEVELPNTSVTLDITATSGTFEPADATVTRASENLYKTEFTNDDQIGVTVIKEGKIVDGVNNICFTYNASTKKWEAAAGSPSLYYYQDVTYLAYYPYDAGMSDKMSEQAIIDAFTPLTDQSTYANYTKSDLMVATGTADRAAKTLSLPFSHKMALVSVSAVTNKFVTSVGYEYTPGEEFAVRNLAETSITIGTQTLKPCSFDDGTFRVIVRPDDIAQTINIKYRWVDLTDYTDQTQQTLTSGKYLHYHFKMPESVPYVRNIQPGDFFFRDGRILPREASVITDPTNCVGIIIMAGSGNADTSDANYGGNCVDNTVHGHAISVYDVATCKWGPNGNIDTNTADSWNDWRGYQITQRMKKDGDTNHGGFSPSNYAAAYHCLNYGNTDRGRLTTNKTSGWYFPSEGYMYQLAIISWGAINGSLTRLVSAGYGQNIAAKSYYWDASTSNSDETARLVQLNPGHMAYTSGRGTSRKVRALVTF